MIFDTDVLIWAGRGDPEAAARINEDSDRSASIVSFMELLQGARSRNEMRSIRHSFQNLGFRILSLTESVGHTAAGLIEEHALSHGLQVADALIAATAIEAGDALMTGNVRHFRPIRNLVLKPFRPAL